MYNQLGPKENYFKLNYIYNQINRNFVLKHENNEK